MQWVLFCICVVIVKVLGLVEGYIGGSIGKLYLFIVEQFCRKISDWGLVIWINSGKVSGRDGVVIYVKVDVVYGVYFISILLFVGDSCVFNYIDQDKIVEDFYVNRVGCSNDIMLFQYFKGICRNCNFIKGIYFSFYGVFVNQVDGVSVKSFFINFQLIVEFIFEYCFVSSRQGK